MRKIIKLGKWHIDINELTLLKEWLERRNMEFNRSYVEFFENLNKRK